tara:strand:+ start:77 stop:460 length:384 start_codon:yes stop_codon:yes gene_type:complete
MNKDTQLIWESYFINEQTGLDTTWEDGDIKITLQDILVNAASYVKSEKINPNELEPLLIQTERDPDRVQAADLQYPIIVTTENGQYKKILDGQHRLEKALQLKVPINARVLNLDEAPEEYQKLFKEA